MRSGRAGKLLADYHDLEYGSPQRDENVLFERLTLETFQAGLSWEIVLKKRTGLAEAFKGYQADCVAAFTPADVDEIVSNPHVIRNRRKVEAAIYNAQQVILLREEFGGFAEWLDHESLNSQGEWLPAFKKRFKFMGGEVVGEFLISLGLIPGAHDPDCTTGLQPHMGSWDQFRTSAGKKRSHK